MAMAPSVYTAHDYAIPKWSLPFRQYIFNVTRVIMDSILAELHYVYDMYQNLQPYAPTPHSYVPNNSLSSTINLDEVLDITFFSISFTEGQRYRANTSQEVVLATSRAERDLQESLAEVFSIIITLDELEKAYLKDAIPEGEYTEICDRLLKQYRAILTDEGVKREFGDLERFKNRWDVSLSLSPSYDWLENESNQDKADV